jgi:hypothetical protein
MNQTAVAWVFERLKDTYNNEGKIDLKDLELYETLAINKEYIQIIESWLDGRRDGYQQINIEYGKEYYNEKYNQNKNNNL